MDIYSDSEMCRYFIQPFPVSSVRKSEALPSHKLSKIIQLIRHNIGTTHTLQFCTKLIIECLQPWTWATAPLTRVAVWGHFKRGQLLGSGVLFIVGLKCDGFFPAEFATAIFSLLQIKSTDSFLLYVTCIVLQQTHTFDLTPLIGQTT